MRSPEQRALNAAGARRYRARHSEAIKSRRKVTYLLNRGTLKPRPRADPLQRGREYYEAHRAAVLAQKKERHERLDQFELLARARETFRRSLARKYGIDVEAYARMCDAQGLRCAVCAVPLDMGRGTHLDHCHASGHVRGLLCHACNTSLGQMQESPARLRALALYIEKHQ